MSLRESFARGYASVMGGRLDQVCRELSWDIDERKGDTIALYFKGDNISPRRTVFVSHSEGNRIMIFACHCRAEFSDRSLPDDLLSAMLLHNEDVSLGAWVASIDNRTVSLSLRYTALSDGIDAANFKLICSMMVKEVAGIEAHLDRKGLMG